MSGISMKEGGVWPLTRVIDRNGKLNILSLLGFMCYTLVCEKCVVRFIFRMEMLTGDLFCAIIQMVLNHFYAFFRLHAVAICSLLIKSINLVYLYITPEQKCESYKNCTGTIGNALFKLI